jgi:hypothetical protein
MCNHSTVFVALDVHQKSIVAAYAAKRTRRCRACVPHSLRAAQAPSRTQQPRAEVSRDRGHVGAAEILSTGPTADGAIERVVSHGRTVQLNTRALVGLRVRIRNQEVNPALRWLARIKYASLVQLLHVQLDPLTGADNRGLVACNEVLEARSGMGHCLHGDVQTLRCQALERRRHIAHWPVYLIGISLRHHGARHGFAEFFGRLRHLYACLEEQTDKGNDADSDVIHRYSFSSACNADPGERASLLSRALIHTRSHSACQT